jgi:class 3 adenylate cyclase/tetratricopeptide (TPR) repeat protein
MSLCSNCGQDNPEGARFCNSCGTALVAAERPAEVRKTVTILFCDVTGSTAMGEKLDPESLRKVMTRYFDAMSTVIESHGGTVEKFIGDAVMAVFGVPVLHEDDALRAARAADEMRAALTQLNVDLERDWDVSIQTRTGVNTGEVVAGSGDQKIVTGDAVNTAARLEQHAEPGQVLIGEQTYRLVRHAVVAEPHEPLSAKGKAEPLPAFRLIRTLEVTPEAGRRLDSPLVGRDNELALAQETFERIVRERSCALFTVFGSAGVGKTRLTQEVIRLIEARATVSRGRCLPYGRGITYWPVTEIIHNLAGLTEGDDVEKARESIRKLLSEEEDPDLIVDRILQLMGLNQDEVAAPETFWAVRKLTEALARRAPIVLVFEDIHWAEPNLLDLIEHIADLSRDAPIMLLCIARPDLLERRTGWGGGKMNASAILLEPLRPDESERLMENLLGGTSLPASITARISDAAEGNPLFVEEMVSMLIDDGLLSRQNGGWEMSESITAVSVPPTIQALLAARLDRLTADERTLVQGAAVIGKEFSTTDVAALMPEPIRERAPSLIMSLVRKELVRPDRDRVGGIDGFRFRHILIRDAAYGAIAKQQRVDLHERFASWLDEHYPDRLAEYQEIIGYHLEQAFENRSSLGPLDESARALSVRAGEHLVSAGRRADSRGDAKGAVNLLERGLALLPDDWDGRIEMETDFSLALWESGDLVRGLQMMRATEEKAHARGDQRNEWLVKVIRIRNELANFPEILADDVKSSALEAIQVFEELGDKEGLARAWDLLASSYSMIGRQIPMLDAALKADAYAKEIGSMSLMQRVRPLVGSALYWGPTPASEGIAWFEDDLAKLSPAQQAAMPGAMGMLLAMVGRVDEGRALHEEAIRRFEERGQRMFALTHRGHGLGNIEISGGDWIAAAREMRSATDSLSAMGEKSSFSTIAGALAIALYNAGEFEEAYRYSEASEEATAPDDFASQIYWRAGRAAVLAAWGRFDEAIHLAQQAVEIAEGTDALMWKCDAYVARGEVYRLLDDQEKAGEDFLRAAQLYDKKEAVLHAARARRKLAEVMA